ncbi:hypothetical protein RSAG8_07986, partial [Rhizoctonia solani AG-8 WAC10335]
MLCPTRFLNSSRPLPSQRRQLEAEDDQYKYTEKVVKHINEVNEAVATSTLTGMALIIAALVHQHLFHSLTLFHAYMVLCLLWVVTLTGMWFVIHAWVFDILRARKRRMATFSFWKRIFVQAKWFTVQFCAMGAYGLYVTTRREDFLPPHGRPPGVLERSVEHLPLQLCDDPIAMCSRKGWKGLVDPIVFCIFWLLEYIMLTVALIVMIETQLKEYTMNDQTQSPFGSTLAMALNVEVMGYGDVPPLPPTPAPPKHWVLLPTESDLSVTIGHPPRAYRPKDHSNDYSNDYSNDSNDYPRNYPKDYSKNYSKDHSKDVPKSPMKPRRPHSPKQPSSPTKSRSPQQPPSPTKPPSKPPSKDCLRTHRDPSKVPSKESLRPHRPKEPFKAPSQDSLRPAQYHPRNLPKSPSKESLREARHKERYLNTQV